MQVATERFHQLASGDVIPLDHGLRISFDKQKADNVEWFTLNKSQLDGKALLKPNLDNPIQLWDTYHYEHYDDRAVSLEFERSLEFPYFVQSAMADITLNNFDGKFTPNGKSSLAQHIRPKRPIRLLAGYQQAGLLPQFVGLTQDMPDIDDNARTVSFHALDFLGEIFEMPLNKTIAMREVTTDVVLRDIFKQFGILDSQMKLSRGINKIAFLFFEKDQKAGEVIKNLLQAEMGKLWLDEQGIIRFNSRKQASDAPVLILTEKDIVSMNAVGKSEIVNHIKITTPLREVQEFQTIHKKDPSGDSTSNLWVVPADGTLKMSLSLEDPCFSAQPPQLGVGSHVSWFTAKTSDGKAVTSRITATGELMTSSYEVTFSNTNLFPIEIDELELWGEPAKQIDELVYEAFDDSWDKDNDHLLEIQENPFLQNYEGAKSFAFTVFDGYAGFTPIIELQIKGNLALQIDDIIEIDLGSESKQYRITYISVSMTDFGMTMRLRAKQHTPRTWFVLNKSQLNGKDMLGF